MAPVMIVSAVLEMNIFQNCRWFHASERFKNTKWPRTKNDDGTHHTLKNDYSHRKAMNISVQEAAHKYCEKSITDIHGGAHSMKIQFTSSIWIFWWVLLSNPKNRCRCLRSILSAKKKFGIVNISGAREKNACVNWKCNVNWEAAAAVAR